MFEKIVTKEQADALDEDLMVQGYLDGLKDITNYSQKEQSYWHGWNNGQVDGGWAEPTSEQYALAQDIVAKKRAH